MREYLRIFRKRWLTVVGVTALVFAAGLAFTLTRSPVYEATAQIFVSTADASDVSQLAQGNLFTQARVQSYTAVATNPEVTTKVVQTLNLSISPDELASKISADAPLNKVLINLHVVDGSAQQAERLANAVAARFIVVVEGIEQPSSGGSSAVKLTVNQPAQLPGAPVSPNIQLNLALSVVIGLFLGLLLAVVREFLDNSFKTADDLSATSHLPTLATVPYDKAAADRAISFRADSHGGRAEAFRQLRVNLQFVDIDRPPKVIAVTSALPGEGKTHIAVNLAASLAEAGNRVCLVEADLRKPTVAKLLGLVPEVGLTTALIGRVEVEDVVQNGGENLAVLTSGQVPPNPAELLASEEFRKLIEHIGAVVDYLVIDTAPLLLVADGVQIATRVDATLLAVRSGKTTKEQVRRALGVLRNVGVSPVGTVLSMSNARGSGTYNYHYYDYGRQPEASQKSEKVELAVEDRA